MKAFKVILTKIESNHNNLRTNEVDGLTLEIPEKDKSFHMTSTPLTEGASIRSITTTPVKEVDKITENLYTFKTLNSTYSLEIYGTEEIG